MYDFVINLPMKLNTIVSENGYNFSGGQRQRLALARALMNGDKVMFFDEATSSLDNITEANIVEYLDKLATTQILIAHRLTTIIDADVIFVLKDGKIVEKGSHRELISKKGEYYKLYYNQKGENVYEIA